MHAFEFAIQVIWLLAPAPILAVAGLIVWAKWRSLSTRRAILAATALAAGSMVLGAALLAFGPAWLRPYLGVRDTSVFGAYTMWTPLPFVLVAALGPIAVWWLNRGGKRGEL